MNTEPETDRGQALRAAALDYVRSTSASNKASKRRSRWTLAVPVAIAGVLVGGGVAFAASGALDTDSSDAEVVEFPKPEVVIAAGAREPFVRDLSELTGEEGTRVPTIDGIPNGYASVIVDADRTDITLYWKGPVPSSIEALIAQYPKLSVQVVSASYSLNEMADARDALMNGLDAKLDGRGRIVWAGPDQRGRGVDFGVQSSDETLDVDSLRRIAAEITNVPADEIEVSEQGVVLF